MKTLKSRKYINYSTEGNAPRAPAWHANLLRYVYFGILLAAAVLAVRAIFIHVAYINGTGMVTFKPITIRAIDDMVIDRLAVTEGDVVRKGQPLLYQRPTHNETTTLLRSGAGTSTDVHERIARTDREIALKKIEQQAISGEVLAVEKELARLRQLSSLEAITAERLRQQQALLEIKRSRYDLLSGEMDVLKNYRSRLSRYAAEGGNVATIQLNGADLAADSLVYSAPIDGEVVQVFRQEHEAAFRNEPILQIASHLDMRIKGYFEQKHLRQLKEGRDVRIVFPDGTHSYGRISKLYVATLALPDEFQKKYEPVRRNIIVDIVPAPGEEQKWIHLDRISVKLRIKRTLHHDS